MARVVLPTVIFGAEPGADGAVAEGAGGVVGALPESPPVHAVIQETANKMVSINFRVLVRIIPPFFDMWHLSTFE
jgi:hypothetical protein